MVTYNPASVTVEVPAFYLTVNGSESAVNVDNYADLSLELHDVPGHKIQIAYYNSNPANGSPTPHYIISPNAGIDIGSDGTYTDSYEVEHHEYSSMSIWIQAYDSTDAVTSNTVKVVVAKPVITNVDWWFYTESAGIETKLAGYGAGSNTYELGSPGGGSDFGVRGQLTDSNGNGINGVTVTVKGFKTSPVTNQSHTDKTNGAVGMFDTGAQTIPKNTSTSVVDHDISVSVP